VGRREWILLMSHVCGAGWLVCVVPAMVVVQVSVRVTGSRSLPRCFSEEVCFTTGDELELV